MQYVFYLDDVLTMSTTSDKDSQAFIEGVRAGFEALLPDFDDYMVKVLKPDKSDKAYRIHLSRP